MSTATADDIAFWKQCWITPRPFIGWVERYVLPRHGGGRFTLDTCATAWNARCASFIGPPGQPYCGEMIGRDGLKTPWTTDGAAWCNAGFKNLQPWVETCARETANAPVICHLTHASHSADWAQFAIEHATACYLAWPRIEFEPDPRYREWLAEQGEEPTGNMRDSYLWVWTPKRKKSGCAFYADLPPWRESKRKRGRD